MTSGENWNTPQAQTCLQQCVTLIKHEDTPARPRVALDRSATYVCKRECERRKRSSVGERHEKDGRMSADVRQRRGNAKVAFQRMEEGIGICSYLSISEKAPVFEALQDMNNTTVKPLIP